MPALPSAADLISSLATNAQMKVTHTQLREYLAGVLGVDGTIATALATLGALGGQYLLRTTVYSVTSADRGRVIDTTGTWTLSLLAAASAAAGFSFVLRNLGTGTITIDPNGSETVDGVTTLAIGAGRAGIVICTGTAWLTVGVTASAAGLFAAGTAALPGVAGVGDPDTGLVWLGADVLALIANGVEHGRISTAGLRGSTVTSLGRLQIGTPAVVMPVAMIELATDVANGLAGGPTFNISHAITANEGARHAFTRSRGTHASRTALISGDIIYDVFAQGHDGTTFVPAGRSRMRVDGPVSTGVMPARYDVWLNNGTSEVQRMTIRASGVVGIGVDSPTCALDVAGAIRCASYTVATVPSASAVGAGAQIYVSNETGGAVLAFSDGTNWRRVTDRAIIS